MSMFDTPANTPVVSPQGQGDYNQGDKGRPGDGRKGPIGTYMNYVNDFIKLTGQNRRQQVMDVMYYHGNQLTPREREELDKRGQPILIINRTRAAVNGMLGVQVQQNTQPRAWPRTPRDEDSADVATDVLRYIADATQLKKQKHDMFYHLLVAGIGGCVLELDKNGQDINIKAFDWNEIIYDPRSRKKDFSDSGYLGFMKWAYADDVKMLYPDSGFDVANIGTGGLAGLADDAGVDRPRMGGWISVDKKRVLLVELHYKEDGVWYKVVFTAAGVLEEGEDWLRDDKGQYYCPVLAASPYVDDDNNRYGVVRDMRSIQDEINKRRSKLLHMLNVAQIQANSPAAVEVNADEARDEAARPDGVIPLGWERVRNADLVQGQQMLLAESKAELERMGPNPAILGRQGADTSGKALAARQDAGMVELSPVFTVMDDLELRIYRTAWLIAKQFWTGPMFIRITDEIQDPTFVGINQPIMGTVQGIDAATGQPAVDPQTGQPIMVQDVLGYKNGIAELDVDIILDTVPGTANLQAEQLANLMDLIARNPTYAQQVPATVLFELTPMPRKREMMAKIQAATAQQQQQQAQQQQVENQLQVQGAQAKIADVQSRATLNQAKAQAEGFNAASYQQQVANSRDMTAAQIQQQAQQWLEKRELERAALALQQQQLNQQQEGGPEPAGPNQGV